MAQLARSGRPADTGARGVKGDTGASGGTGAIGPTARLPIYTRWFVTDIGGSGTETGFGMGCTNPGDIAIAAGGDVTVGDDTMKVVSAYPVSGFDNSWRVMLKKGSAGTQAGVQGWIICIDRTVAI